MNILLLEDEPNERQAITRLLEKNDHAVTACSSMSDLHAFLYEDLKDNPDLRPDLVIFDIYLQHGETGIDAGKKFYHLLSPVPLVWMTKNYDDAKLLEEIRKAGLPAAHFLPKTLIANEDAFVQTLHNIALNAASPAERARRSLRRLGFKTDSGAYRFIRKEEFICATPVQGGCRLFLSDGTNLTHNRSLDQTRRFLEKDWDNLLKLNAHALINLEKLQGTADDDTLLLELDKGSLKLDISARDITTLRKKGLIFLARD